LVYVGEPRRGVAYARNRGVEVARGEILAFTDDDCVPEPGWLRAMAERFASDPTIGLVGGKTLSHAPESRGWIGRFCFEMFSGD